MALIRFALAFVYHPIGYNAVVHATKCVGPVRADKGYTPFQI